MKETLPTTVSGFCSNNQHEGTRPKSPSGKPMKVCVFWQTCSCECHKNISEMYQLTGLPRIEVGNPEYEPYQSSFSLSLLIETRKPVVSVRESPKLDGPEPVFNDTATGRASQGQLEYWVKTACEEWFQAPEDFDDEDEQPLCTLKWLSEHIAESRGVDLPSQGAIHAVLLRWEKLGYATIMRDPFRYIGLTVEGMTYGLDVLKARRRMMIQ